MKGEVHDEAALVMAPGDTVATALEDMSEGRSLEVNGETVELVEEVAFGHKFALVAHEAGDEVRKYGEVVGRASAPVRPGEHMHTHNCESARGRGDLADRNGHDCRDDRGTESADSSGGDSGGASAGASAVDGEHRGGERR